MLIKKNKNEDEDVGDGVGGGGGQGVEGNYVVVWFICKKKKKQSWCFVLNGFLLSKYLFWHKILMPFKNNVWKNKEKRNRTEMSSIIDCRERSLFISLFLSGLK